MSYDRQEVDFGWELPPGLHEGMIPGNRPEDIEYDKRWEELLEKAVGFMDELATFILAHELDTTPIEFMADVSEAMGGKE